MKGATRQYLGNQHYLSCPATDPERERAGDRDRGGDRDGDRDRDNNRDRGSNRDRESSRHNWQLKLRQKQRQATQPHLITCHHVKIGQRQATRPHPITCHHVKIGTFLVTVL